MKLLENININEHAIKLIKDKQLPYGPIYAFSPVELETLKSHIEIHLKTESIQLFKSLVSVPIFFDKKPNSNFCLYVNY